MPRKTRANAGTTTKPVPAEVTDVSTRGPLKWTLEDTADLVLGQGYTVEYAARRTGFALVQVESYVGRQAKSGNWPRRDAGKARGQAG